MRKFDTVFRGYDKVQVQKCLDEIINNYEQLLRKSQKTVSLECFCFTMGVMKHGVHIVRF